MPYPSGAVERVMKVHEVIRRALDGQLTWIQAAEILGRSPRSIRRVRRRLQVSGYDGLFDRRRQTLSPKRAPVAAALSAAHRCKNSRVQPQEHVRSQPDGRSGMGTSPRCEPEGAASRG